MLAGAAAIARTAAEVEMRLYKAHGLGNDYLVLESGEPMDPSRCRLICERHRGAGADGILTPTPSDRADFGVQIWNPDGSLAEKSGNGLRIFARWLFDVRGAPRRFSVDTGACVVGCEVHPDGEVTVEMGRAAAQTVTLDVQTAPPLVTVDLGNPHCVWFTDRDPDALPWRALGAQLERHPHFPNRTNVQFVHIDSDGSGLSLRIWERGAGETSASGSSACAATAAAVATGRLVPGTYRPRMEGGELQVTVDASLEVTLRGPVAPVCRIEWLGDPDTRPTEHP